MKRGRGDGDVQVTEALGRCSPDPPWKEGPPTLILLILLHELSFFSLGGQGGVIHYWPVKTVTLIKRYTNTIELNWIEINRTFKGFTHAFTHAFTTELIVYRSLQDAWINLLPF